MHPKSLAVTAALLIAVSACGSDKSPHANPSPSLDPAQQEQVFVAALKSSDLGLTGIVQGVDDAHIISLGHSVCSSLDQGTDPKDAGAKLAQFYGYTVAAKYLIVLTQNLCPENYTKTYMAFS